MIYDVYQIGKAMSGQSGAGELEALYQTDTTDVDYILSIDFDFDNDVLVYQGIGITEYNPSLGTERFLLRKGGSNGPNFGPSAKKTEIPKTVEKKILAWFRDASKENKNQELFSRVAEYMGSNLADICKEIEERAPADKKAKLLITVRIGGRFPKDVPAILEYYKTIVDNKITGKGEELNGTCCLCKKRNSKLIPAVNVFKFYTKDKPGFISGGFQEEMFWRNCPVCTSCEPVLREGKQYMLSRLHFRFYGMDYYILPSTTQYHTVAELSDMMDKLNHHRFSFQEVAEDEFRNADEDFWDYLKEEADIHSFRMVFFKQDNSAERILLDVKDVFPSRFRELYDAKERVRKGFEEVSKQKFNFRYYRDFLSKTEKEMRNNDLDTLFLQLTQAIFLREKVSLDVLLPHYLREIRKAFHAEQYFHNTVLKAVIGVRYLQEIGCMTADSGQTEMDENELMMEGGEKMSDNSKENNCDEKLSLFLSQYNAGFDTPLKQALILTGVLVQKVLNIQAYNLNGSTPFRSRLKGFKMRQRDVNGLMSDAIEKMNEFETYSADSRKIYQEIVKRIGKSPAVWPLTADELNFYVSAGMPLMEECYEMIKEEKK